ncbi:MAG: hydroxymethylglutaryl-CoA lyase, partial [Comamonadaceae bacterium]
HIGDQRGIDRARCAADAQDLLRRISRTPGTIYTALIPNVRGLERALEVGVDEMNLVMSASETHNRANLRMTREQSLGELKAILQHARAQGDVPCNVSLSTAFGCPFEGDISPDDVVALASELVAAGARGVTLCDTTGMAFPTQVAALCDQVARALGERIPVTLHLHNTRGMALANAVAGWQTGITRFDAAVGGLGGCPYAPGASGNVNTEELVHMFACMGVDTGVDLRALLEIVSTLPGLVQRTMTTPLLTAGPRLQTHPAPAWLAERFPQQGSASPA